MRPVVLLATRNEGKIGELRALFAELGVDTRTLTELGVPEDVAAEREVELGATFEANAEAKARYFFARGGGISVVADDSGLEVDSLGGGPGVRTRRWAGCGDRPDGDSRNICALLLALAGVEDRTARFVAAAAWCGETGLHVSTGETRGRILSAPRGAGGFGYDPIFLPEGSDLTFGEMEPHAKHAISHRARAFRRLAEEAFENS